MKPRNGWKQGILDGSYAEERKFRKPLICRYRYRAYMVFQMVKSLFPSNKKLTFLDLGAADGKTLLALRDYIPSGDYTGVEYSAALIRCTPELPGNVRIIQADIEDLPSEVRDCKYDVITALAVLEHLDDPAEAVSRIRDMLTVNGFFIATCPAPVWDHMAQRSCLLEGDHHTHAFNRANLIRLFQENGYDVVKYERFMLAVIGFLPYIGIPVSQKLCFQTDKIVRFFRIFNGLFVNQCIIAARKS